MRSPFSEEERNAALNWYLREKVRNNRSGRIVARAENGAIPMAPAAVPETPRRKTIAQLRASGYDIPEQAEGRMDRCAGCGARLFNSEDLYVGYHDHCEKRMLTNGGNTLF